MSDFDTEPNVGQDGADSVAELQKKIAALEKDNAKYREERRRAADEAFLAKYGEDIVAKVKDLPDEHRERMADTLLELRPAPSAPDEQAPTETPTEEIVPGAAAVVKEPASGNHVASQSMTLDEFNRHVEDIGLEAAAIQYGALVDIPNNPFKTGQPVDIQGTYRPPKVSR